MTFPLRARPKESYHVRPRAFGCPRGVTPHAPEGTRKHAGCDLYAKPGDEVLAMCDGTVTRGLHPFYDRVYDLQITAEDGRVFRYGEICTAVAFIKVGAKVTEGQVIAHVGQLESVKDAMLHLEVYDGTATGDLTDRANKPFERRADLIDPTALLDGAECPEPEQRST